VQDRRRVYVPAHAAQRPLPGEQVQHIVVDQRAIDIEQDSLYHDAYSISNAAPRQVTNSTVTPRGAGCGNVRP
jgi:hypothetical protein